ncbi:MAG: N-acetyl-D-Glu racemase DgcA [Hyphomonadaceae bacterium]
MPNLKLTITAKSSALATVFTISRGSKSHAETVIATLDDGTSRGRGECVPYTRYGETIESVTCQIEAMRANLAEGMDREALQSAMPAGAARCAIDCALWDYEAKASNTPVWQLAGLPEPKPMETAVTVVLGKPAEMAEAAKHAPGTLLKLKLGHEGDIERLEAVHAARPDARLILDANEGLTPKRFSKIATAALDMGVVLIEQPFPADNDAALIRGASPVPICADESVHTSADIPALAQIYDGVNIKLDKTGGLTEAIKMMKAAQDAKMYTMVGCMVAGSLSMAPAVMLGRLADFVDLDGPLWLAEDIAHGLEYENGILSPPKSELWG